MLKRVLALICAFLMISGAVSATTYYSIASGSWTSNLTWSTTPGHSGPAGSGGAFPLAGDIVFIGGGDAVVVPHNVTTFAATITVSDDGTICSLTIGNNVNISNSILTVSSSITINSGGSVIVGGTINNAGRTATLSGAAITLNGTGALTLGNASTQVSTVTATTLTLNGTSIVTVGSNSNASHVLTCSGAVSIGSGTTLRSGGNTGGTHTINFQSTLDNIGIINFAAATDQITMNVTGATTNSGTLTFGIDNGVKTFIGAVSNTGTWTSTVLATTTNLIFRNGVSSTAGTFAAGGATFNTNTQSIGGTTAMSFSGVVTIAAGITVNNTNTNTLTLSNTGVALASGGAGSTFTQGTTTNTLSYAGSSIGVAIFNGTGANNTVIYTGATPAILATTYNNLTYNTGAGPATIGGATTVNGTMTVSSPVTNNNALTVTTALSGGSTLTQGASSTLNIGGASGITGLTASAASNSVNYTGTAQTIKTPTASTYLNLGLSGSGNKTFGAALTISGNLSITGAVANLGTFIHTANSLTLGGTGQVGGSHGGTASIATTKNDTYFLSTSTGRVNVATCTAPSTGTATTYYSRNATSGGNWNDNTSWTTSSDGTGGPLAAGVWPRIYDNVVIRSGHTITVDAITDNNYCGISPDGLGRSNVGPFTGSNVAMFYQTGDLLIDGALTVSEEIMIENYTHVTSTGNFSSTTSMVNLGYLEVDNGATFSSLDDLILAGISSTIVNTNSISTDDLIISFTSATLCGTGATTLQNGAGSVITYANGATVAQICSSYTVNCTGGGCAGSFPVTGTGSVILGNTGPGGIDKSDGTGSLEFWLDSYDVNGNGTNPANGATVATWSDKSGNGVNVTQNIANVATYSATGVTFNNTGYLLGSDVTFPSGGTARTAYVCASTLNTTTDDVLFFYGNDVASQSYGILKTAAETVRNYFYGDDLDDAGGWLPATQTKVVNTRYASNFREIFVDGTLTTSDAATPNTPVGVDGVQVGGWSAFNLHSNATIKEVILHSKAINNAQRIIINNYLAAKYNSTLASNDIYTMDNGANGNYDYQMAGIGQASDGSNHKDAKGPGIVRMWNPNGLGNSEFLLWGHDNTTLSNSTTAGVLAPVQERLSRTWRLSEAGDVGSVSISFDISTLTGTPLGSNLRLLIDRDGDGFGDNDVTPIAGTFVDNLVVFSGVNFQTGDRFTLGNIDVAVPLPIELLSFSAKVENNVVRLNWSTASELNNDFFTIERASNIEKFEEIGRPIPGSGTTHEKRNYSDTDENPLYGRSYYRLKQTDFDGKFAYSKLVSVNVEGSSLASLRIYPNPLNNKQALKVEMAGLKGVSEVPIIIYNSLGQKILEKTIAVDQIGMVQEEFLFAKPLSSGVFIVKAGPTLQLTQRLVVE